MSVDIPYHPPVEAKLNRGVILNTPAAVGDKVYVRIDSYGTRNSWLVVNWEPHGSTLPTAGAACLVASDEDNGRWIVSWEGPWP